jgi:hypothetical protein
MNWQFKLGLERGKEMVEELKSEVSNAEMIIYPLNLRRTNSEAAS